MFLNNSIIILEYMILSRIRKWFHKAVDPLINFLVFLKITPNMVTTSALLFLFPTLYFIMNKNTFWGGIFMGITSVIDAVDGAVADKVGTTRFGDFYDAVIDRLVEGTFFVAISLGFPEYTYLCFLAFLFSYMVSYVGARAEVWTIGIKMKYLSIGSRAGRLTVLVGSLILGYLRIGLIIVIIIALIALIGRSFVTMVVLRKAKKTK